MQARHDLLAWGLGAGSGAGLALALGAYGPSWGVALAFPTVALMFAVGAWIEHEGEAIAHLLRLTLGFTAGFLLITAPLAFKRLAELSQAASGEQGAALTRELARLRQALFVRWSVIALALPIGLTALWLRATRATTDD